MIYTVHFILRGDVRLTVKMDAPREEFITSDISNAIREDSNLYVRMPESLVMIRGGEILAAEIMNPDNND